MRNQLLLASLALSLLSSAQEEPAKEPQEAPETAPEIQEFTLKTAPFAIETELEGILVPTKTQTLLLSPKRWKSFQVETVSQHGAAIKAGEPLLTFKTDAIEKDLVEKGASVKSQELKLAIANRELTELQQKNELALAAAKRRMDNAEADLAYYESTGQPAKKESLTNSLQQYQDFLIYQKEELTQLLKMYEEDDITEETEEIILVRQKARVRDAENNLKEQKRKNAYSLEVSLPRELVKNQESVETARIDYATAKLNLERNYELKKLEVDKLDRALTEAKEMLAELQEDRKLFDVVAEFDGNLVYGEFSNGQWKKGKSPEFLKTGGSVPSETTCLTLVASDSTLSLQSLIETEKMEELQASLTEAGENAPSVEIAPYPNLDGKHLVTLEAQPAEDFQFPGQKEKTELVFYQVEQAIVIPASTIKTKEDGTSYVLVKLSEGDPEERTIELGKKSEDNVEVLSGLEEGQVILP